MMRPAPELEAVLDGTYDALMQGDLMALGGFADRLDTFAVAIGAVDRADAERLLRKADRNARLMQAASRGIRAAQGRVAEITAEPALTTYDARGRRQEMGQVSGLAARRF